MANASDIYVVGSPKPLAVGESRAYQVDFTQFGTPSGVGTTTAYDAAGTDVTATVLTGANSLSGNVVTLAKITPASEQMYRLVCSVTIGGQTKYAILDVAAFTVTHTVTAPGASSYGTLAQVAALTPKFASRAGTFDDATRPTGAQVAAYIDQVSSIINALLAQNGFSIPVTDADATPAIILFVTSEVAAIVEGINGSGRFGPTVAGRRGGRKSRLQLIMEDAKEFIEIAAIGMERMGATRAQNVASGLGFRQYDESGDEVKPLFQREQFGEEYKDWDA